MISLNTSIDVRVLGASLLATDKEIARVNRLVTNKIVRDVHREVGKLQPRKTGTNVFGFRKVRVRKSKLLVRNRNTAGKVWVGGDRISASFGGRMRNVNGGAKAGRHFFANSFVQTVRKNRGGFTSIWKRGLNTKLVEQTFEVVDFEITNEKALGNVIGSVPSFLNSELERVLNNISGVRGLR
jgi:hypothetical protein